MIVKLELARTGSCVSLGWNLFALIDLIHVQVYQGNKSVWSLKLINVVLSDLDICSNGNMREGGKPSLETHAVPISEDSTLNITSW